MTATTTDRLVPVGTWAIDVAHSSATFEAEHAGVSTFRGGFTPIDAKLVSGDDGLELEGVVRVETISVDDENIRPHLLSPDFFDVGRNPEVSFRSTSIDGPADDLRVRGDLSMAGFELPVEATGRLRGPVRLSEDIERLSLSLEATVDRTAFGMNWQMELPDGNQALANDVRLVVELEFQKS
jgi:polyisoprenoid-binding protein YceI